ncbi:E3 ubiquitin-protein ligase PPP1R11-like [Uloborus diversus]|uniref:E3 ubiquitin-protein ligase PPP1R11-like n=1 Tax=Uloborus diversus TaxID=327109 RepID=UPI002409D75A|nr:E3 ubiquitin-protein ligase PPP1R11-like [Uloborus diversus]XP_054709910.1 E3 ubiquitin-protein ligase PPP1R11-like [Uloborus diversus]XP_054709911.1 E3 ubiquitin-protein ligase PPP1R11-like [Uloborus diversus]
MAAIQRVEQSQSTSTLVVAEEHDETAVPSVRMKLKKPKGKKKVAFSPDTVDNENMNKKKSKCCCIYEKPREFGESSSESDDECEHCKGHVEHKRRPVKNGPSHEQNHMHSIDGGSK